MNKTAIKNFAIWARVQLIESVKQRAFEYEITEDGENKANVDSVGGRLLTADEKKQRTQLIFQIKEKGYTQVMEEAAYTWFNRFIALRFMEVNGYLPSKTRVFTDENNAFKPEIMKEAMQIELDGLDRNRVLKFLDEQNNEELYKYLLIAQCNALNAGLPYMFERIANWTELLFPANILRSDSVVGQMISEIPEEDWTDAVQIIGWMYQYYNSELKDDTFALLKKNVKISKERIPAATQLFTPDWIVRYLVENSLGRLWYEGYNNFDKSQWKYYLDEAEQEPEVEQQLKKIRAEYATIKPEEIKIIDPCMGSGHILVYAFDVLMQIYTSVGWSERDAAKSIIENNLYGLDIDDRAGQLAYFAVMMKARKYSRHVLNGDVKPNIFSLQESNWMDDDFIAYVAGKDANMKADLVMLRKTFKDAKEYGSILNMSVINHDALLERIDIIGKNYIGDLFEAQYQLIAREQLLFLVKQSQVMSQKYDVVVTNPPYMGGLGMGAQLDAFVKKHYPDSKSDLFAVFIEKCGDLTKSFGYQAMITQHAWMFLSSYERLRTKLIKRDTVSMVHLGARAFEEIGGEVVQTTAFILKNTHTKQYKGVYCRLISPTTQQGKENMFLSGENRFVTNEEIFLKIPGSPVAYWAPSVIMSIYEKNKLNDIGQSRKGMATGLNDEFVRCWFEIEYGKMGFVNSRKEAAISTYKWFPYANGGEYRRWYGNNIYVVNWENDGFRLQNEKTDDKSRIRAVNLNLDYIFRKGFVWTSITSSKNSFRILPNGFLFSSASNAWFPINEDYLKSVLAFVNSKTAEVILKMINPTLNANPNDIGNLPLDTTIFDNDKIIENSSQCISKASNDWDSFEISWDFRKHPVVPQACETGEQISSQFVKSRVEKFGRIAWHYEKWEKECSSRFNQLKANEEELNRIFIDIYGLQDELTPEVEDKDVTVRKADLQRDIKSLISYAVGCMFGRYSLDEEGLCYAGGEWNSSKYKTIIPDNDNIIPICDDEYFDDDIVGKFVDFIRKVYGEDTLEENLRFIADALGGKGTPREVIRNYFINGFYEDHLKIYQKRPIYWLFSSGKKNGFKALIYMHRYQPDLLARMRTDYVHEQQERYRTQLQMLEDSVQTAAPSERVKLNKQIAKLKDQSLEIHTYEEKIHHLADQMISIDLDDGVKVNYAKFQEVLEKIK